MRPAGSLLASDKAKEGFIRLSFGCKIAIQKARKFQPTKISNAIAASDAFFPFSDGLDLLIKAGVKIVIQPGGSIRDKEIINYANKAKIKMLFTGIRHFYH